MKIKGAAPRKCFLTEAQVPEGMRSGGIAVSALWTCSEQDSGLQYLCEAFRDLLAFGGVWDDKLSII